MTTIRCSISPGPGSHLGRILKQPEAAEFNHGHQLRDIPMGSPEPVVKGEKLLTIIVKW